MTRVAALALALAACDSMPLVACEPTGAIEAIDVNGDGQPDIRKVVVRGREVCRETDLDLDGRPETITVRDAGGGVAWHGADFDGDGRCDRVDITIDGTPVRTIGDLDHDGRPDL